MVAESAEARERRLAEVRSRIANADKTLAHAERQLEHLDAQYRDREIDAAEMRRLREPPKSEHAAATDVLDGLRADEHAILSEADLADAEQETLVALAELRARFAEGIATAGDVEATQAALRRLFEHFVLCDLRDARKGGRPVKLPKGKLHMEPDQRLIGEPWDDFIIEPVPHERMVVTEPIELQGASFKRERLAKVPLQTAKSGSTESAR